MFSPLYLDNFISATRITPQVGKSARRARRPRRSKLRILRFRASTKAQSLRCFSSPHKAVRLCGGPQDGRAGNAPWAALAGCIMPPNLFGHTMSGLHVRQAAVAGVESSRDPFHEL